MATPNKLTDADVMTGFNPAFGVSAEEVEARQDDAESIDGAAPEGDGGSASETETQDASAAPEVEVRLDGRTFKAPKDIAEAFTREINRRDGTRGAELQELRQRLANVEARSTTAPTKPESDAPTAPPVPDPELQIENPAEYQKQLLAHVRYEQEQKALALAKQYDEAEAAKDRENARRAAWEKHVSAFYSKPENAVLRDNQDIVDLVMEQNKEVLAPLSVEDGFKELSRLAKERLARVTGQAPEVKARTTPRPPVLEGSARRDAARAPRSEKDTGPQSLSAAIRERRKAAAAAFKPQPRPASR